MVHVHVREKIYRFKVVTSNKTKICPPWYVNIKALLCTLRRLTLIVTTL